ncbi:nucleotide-diphospho-sugar transferase [Trichophaea hybrida]|nr:nucleotide-diphospho-sugar transferase [Trichophaea hybrida]
MTAAAFAEASPLSATLGGGESDQILASSELSRHPFWGWFALVYYIMIWMLIIVGYSWIRRTYAKLPPPPQIPNAEPPFVTILRPIKGCDPNLHLCLVSTCLLDYPPSQFELVFCIASDTDPAIKIVNDVRKQHPNINAKLVISEEDVGPNPKIRNLSQSYREATGDIVWILDCNVWVTPGTLRRAVELLEGTQGRPGYKLVHHLPIAFDITPTLSRVRDNPSSVRSSSSPLLRKDPYPAEKNWLTKLISHGGGRLEENFLSSSHAKFYSAINTLGLASCVVGKSELFRRSHLAEVTRDGGVNAGLNYFADYICEDHMISAKLWRTPLEEERTGKRKWGKHAMCPDIVFQPLSDMSISEYIARRVRWISVRKYTELFATLMENTTESISMSLIGAYAATTIPFISDSIGTSWFSFGWAWLFSMFIWATFDRHLFNFIHSYRSTIVDEHSPAFIANRGGRSLGAWILQWIGREGLGSYVWIRSLLPGPIAWRGGLYRIKWSDKKVVEIDRSSSSRGNGDKRRD